LDYRSGDTIAAVATPPGRGAVAIVRLSGPRALAIARRMTGVEPAPRTAHVCIFRDSAGQRIDQGLLLYFPAPRSYTGEDVIELQGHGGQVVSEWLLAGTLALGARAAGPGEFTLRAFLNDKLDLAQAEAVADLIDSGSRAAALAAGRSLQGRFSSAVDSLQASLTELRVQLEAWLDFPDEEIERDACLALSARLGDMLKAVEELLAQARQGRLLTDGLAVVIAGPPNAGKSSLLNRLAGYDAAIVTAIPGTTRDPLREELSFDGLPVSIVDTAGLRTATDVVEAEGVRRAEHELAQADRVLWVAEVEPDALRAIAEARAAVGSAKPFTLVQNKTDLTAFACEAFEQDGVPVIRLSALTGQGIALLREHVKDVAGYRGEVAGTFSARTRHLEALRAVRGHLAAAGRKLEAPVELELAAEELHGAQRQLGELTGKVTSDDLLGRIFASFCIGK
jgi:tRNA modification GTPase